MHILPLIVGFYFASLTLLFDLTFSFRLGQKYKHIFICFLVQMKTLKSPFKINWPLAWRGSIKFSNHHENQQNSRPFVYKSDNQTKDKLWCQKLCSSCLVNLVQRSFQTWTTFHSFISRLPRLFIFGPTEIGKSWKLEIKWKVLVQEIKQSKSRLS